MIKSLSYVLGGLLVVGGIVYYLTYATAHKPITQETQTVADGTTHEYINDPRSIQKLLRDPTVKTRVKKEDVVRGGVPKDGIPAIDVPLLVRGDDVPAWLDRAGDGIGVSFDGHDRFYPYQVLAYHEIVNDIVGTTPLLVTYCPLCYTGIVYNPLVDDKRTTFGVSGVLIDSNLIMYNRSNPESLWHQASGEAIIGPHVGDALEVYPFDMTTLQQFLSAHPTATVVVGDKNHPRTYDKAIYGGDLRDPNLRFPNSGEHDRRLAPTARIVGLRIGTSARAYPIERVAQTAPFEETLGERNVRVEWDDELGAVRIFDITNGANKRLPLRASFWFSWVATYPQTSVYKK